MEGTAARDSTDTLRGAPFGCEALPGSWKPPRQLFKAGVRKHLHPASHVPPTSRVERQPGCSQPSSAPGPLGAMAAVGHSPCHPKHGELEDAASPKAAVQTSATFSLLKTKLQNASWPSLAPCSLPSFGDSSSSSPGKCVKRPQSVPPHQHGAGIPTKEQELRGWKGQQLGMESCSRSCLPPSLFVSGL